MTSFGDGQKKISWLFTSVVANANGSGRRLVLRPETMRMGRQDFIRRRVTTPTLCGTLVFTMSSKHPAGPTSASFDRTRGTEGVADSSTDERIGPNPPLSSDVGRKPFCSGAGLNNDSAVFHTVYVLSFHMNNATAEVLSFIFLFNSGGGGKKKSHSFRLWDRKSVASLLLIW